MELETQSDILEWANTTVAANGEKFTPLSKKSQLVLAKFILQSMDGVRKCSDVTEPCKQECGGEYIRTRADRLHEEGVEAQKAFDLFLDWARDSKTGTTVMDFGTGQRSEAAAFAYWLTGKDR